MRTVKVKICGITREEDLESACKLGADMVGFIVSFAMSPRSISLERAKQLFNLIPNNVKSVLVTVPKSIEEILEAYLHLKPDIIQIHGEFLDLRSLKRRLPEAKIVRAIPITGVESIKRAINEATYFDGVLVDSHVAGKIGGTGVTHDWGISRLVRDAVYPKPLVLAGGLNSSNVAEAIKVVKPYAVDVSTSVESSPGVKDHAKIKAFIKEAKGVMLEDDYCGSNL
jgi:phosphoribosylanthranilate isomerase